MQTTYFRYLILTAVLLTGTGLYAASGQSAGVGTARWPVTDDIYAVQPWSVGSEAVTMNEAGGAVTPFATRVFRRPDGATAVLTVVSSQAPKLYGAGAEVPFLGNGYTVEPAPEEFAALGGDGVSALVARRGAEQWLVMYGYGERRGLLGNGPLPWTLAVLDRVLAQPNDYYKLYLAVRTDRADTQMAVDVVALAHTLFPRIAAWYRG